MNVLNVSDLVNQIPPVPFVAGGRDQDAGVDCFWVAMEVQRRLGLVVPALADIDPVSRPAGVTMKDWITRANYFWPEVDADEPRKVGDVIYWEEGIGDGCHCSVVVNSRRGSEEVLTTGPAHGLRVKPLRAYKVKPTSVHEFRT